MSEQATGYQPSGETRAVLNSLLAHVAIIDCSGRIIFVNNAWRTFCGANGGREESCCEGANYLHVTQHSTLTSSPEGASETLSALEDMVGEHPATTKFQIIYPCHSPTQRRWFELTATPLPCETPCVVLVHQEITHLVLIRELQDEYERAISHDLRIPVQAILGYTQIMERTATQTDGSRRSLAAIRKNCRRLDAMIRELREAAQLEAGRADFDKTSILVGWIIYDCVLPAFPPDEQARMQIEGPTDGPLLVLADENRLCRVIVNLLSNALKYSPENTPVRLAWYRKSDDVVIEVQDQGPGIPPKDQANIFDRYFRSGSTKHKEGLGLGLYISRLIVLSHGGRIWVESAVGKGSTFYVALPLIPSP